MRTGRRFRGQIHAAKPWYSMVGLLEQPAGRVVAFHAQMQLVTALQTGRIGRKVCVPKD